MFLLLLLSQSLFLLFKSLLILFLLSKLLLLFLLFQPLSSSLIKSPLLLLLMSQEPLLLLLLYKIAINNCPTAVARVDIAAPPPRVHVACCTDVTRTSIILQDEGGASCQLHYSFEGDQSTSSDAILLPRPSTMCQVFEIRDKRDFSEIE